MKKVSIFFLLFLWIVGAIGGVGYAVYYKVDYPIIVGLVIAILFGIPTAKWLWNKINE